MFLTGFAHWNLTSKLALPFFFLLPFLREISLALLKMVV